MISDESRRALSWAVKRITAVIFDMDGVLIDSEPQHFESTNLCLEPEGAYLDEDAALAYLGWNERAFWGALKERFGLTKDVEHYIAERSQIVVELLRRDLPVAEGALELLEELHSRGVSLAVASSSERDLIEYVLEESGFARFFQEIASGCEVTRSKPDPEIFLLAATRLQVDPSECLVFEDAPHGVKGALAAGMSCIRVVTRATEGMEFPELNGAIECFAELDLDRILNQRSAS